MEELKPCPLCGGEAKFGINKSCCGKTVRIDCTNPQCGANINAYSSKAEAAKVWNRRPAPENKLTLENGFEITNADGTPIDYEALGLEYKNRLCYCDIDGFYIGEDGQLVLMDDCGKSVPVDRGDYHIEVRKPEEDDHEKR